MGIGMILSSFLAALGQIGDPRFRKVLLLGIGLTFGLLVATYAGLLVLINLLLGDGATVPVLGEVHWLDDLLSVSSFIFMLILSMFLMADIVSHGGCNMQPRTRPARISRQRTLRFFLSQMF